MDLGHKLDIRVVGVPIAAASNTSSPGTRVDMQNYDGVIFIAALTNSVATGVATIQARQHTLDQDSGMTVLPTALATVTSASTDDIANKTLIVEVSRPQKRYVQLVRTSATANITFGHVIAILYDRRVLPSVLDATVARMVATFSPSE